MSTDKIVVGDFSTTNPLSTSCMLVYLTISQWMGKRADKKGSDAAAQAFGADSRKAGVYSKHLVPPSALEGINKAANAMRQAHYLYTLPWLDGGCRILSNKGFFKYQEEIQKERENFERAVEKFIEDYPTYVQTAQQHLGGMFDPRDYPRDIKERFGVRRGVLPMPSSEDFRVKGLEEKIGEIKESIQNASQSAQEAARADIKERVEGVVGRIVERLKSYQKDPTSGSVTNPFRDSLITNARELVEILPMLNVGDDPKVEALTKELDLLSDVDPSDLREDQALRDLTAAKAAEIMKKMESYF